MKFSTVAAVALLSGVSLAEASPKAPDCKAPPAVTITATVTQTSVLTQQAAAASSSSASASASASSSDNSGNNGNNSGSSTDTTNFSQNGGNSGSSNSGSSSSSSGSGSSNSGSSGSSDSAASAVNFNANTPQASAVANQVVQHNSSPDGGQVVQSCPTGSNVQCTEATYNAAGVLQYVHVITISATTDSSGNVVQATSTLGDTPQVTPAAKLDVDANGNGGDSGIEIDTDWVDVTKTSTETMITTSDGRKTTVTKTHTHSTMVIATGTGSATNAKPTHKVTVGKDGQTAFDPISVQAAKGDVVRFTFFPRNHSVTTADEDAPCVDNGVFTSGYKYTFIKNSTTFIDYPVTDDSKGQYFFSAQGDECKNGMYFAINPSPSKYADFQAKAKTFNKMDHRNGTAGNGNGTDFTDRHQKDNGTGFNATEWDEKHHNKTNSTKRAAMPVRLNGRSRVLRA